MVGKFVLQAFAIDVMPNKNNKHFDVAVLVDGLCFTLQQLQWPPQWIVQLAGAISFHWLDRVQPNIIVHCCSIRTERLLTN